MGGDEAAEGGEGGLTASSDGFSRPLPAAPPAGDRGESVRCSGGAPAPASLLTAAAPLTRRALLAGAVGGGAAALPSPSHRLRRRGPPSPRQGEGLEQEWAAALAALLRAEAEIAAFKRVEPKGAPFAAQWDMDEAFSDLACAQNAALERLLLVPAPDLAALAAKLARTVEELAWELPQADATVAQLAADAERLSREVSGRRTLTPGCVV